MHYSEPKVLTEPKSLLLSLHNNDILVCSYGSGTGSADDGTVPEGLPDKMFAGWFCFVQTDDGKVVTIYHSKDDLPDIVNFKKGVASAFQDNFKHTEEEEEDDPQSKHRSHYT